MNATTNQTMGRRLLIMAGTICLASQSSCPPAVPTSRLADRRDHSGHRGDYARAGHRPEPGTPSRNLRFADFSGGLDLSGSLLYDSWLDNADSLQANLTGVTSTLPHLNGRRSKAQTVVNGTVSRYNLTWPHQSQLYSTASYQNRNRRHCAGKERPERVELYRPNFTNASLRGSTLTNANLMGAKLTEVN